MVELNYNNMPDPIPDDPRKPLVSTSASGGRKSVPTKPKVKSAPKVDKTKKSK